MTTPSANDAICALDTSTPLATAVITRQGVVVAEIERLLDRAHGEGLVPLLDELFVAAGIGPGDIGRWAVGIGPGSFTGTRIAVATVKGIVLATGAEIVGVSAFDALVCGIEPRSGERIVAVLDAMKGELFVRVDGHEPFFATPGPATERVRELFASDRAKGEVPLLVGRAALQLTLPSARSVVEPPHDVPHARAMAAVGARLPPSELALLEPEYVRPAEITKPTKR